MTKQQLQICIEWASVAFVVIAAVIAWWQSRFSSGATNVSVYDVFPLLGLLAFGLMWTHFVTGASRRLLRLKSRRSVYWKISSGLVLALIIAHPLLLNIGLVRDGFGLPPGSYNAAYGMLAPWLIVGTISLFVFLSFELHRWYRERSWWKYIEWAQLVAMIAIFFHALTLGRELSLIWYTVIWWGLGLTFVASVVYTKYRDSMTKKEANR